MTEWWEERGTPTRVSHLSPNLFFGRITYWPTVKREKEGEPGGTNWPTVKRERKRGNNWPTVKREKERDQRQVTGQQ